MSESLVKLAATLQANCEDLHYVENTVLETAIARMDVPTQVAILIEIGKVRHGAPTEISSGPWRVDDQRHKAKRSTMVSEKRLVNSVFSRKRKKLPSFLFSMGIGYFR